MVNPGQPRGVEGQRHIGYIVYINGELLEEDGLPVVFEDEKAARKTAGIEGTIAPYFDSGPEDRETLDVSTDTGEVSVPEEELTDLERTYAELLAVATKTVKVRDPIAEHGTERYRSQICIHVLAQTEHKKKSIRTIQAMTVAEVARDRLHLFYPHKTLNTIRDFLELAGLNKEHGYFYELAPFGEITVPYLEAHNIDYMDNLAPAHWEKTREALSAIKNRIQDGASPEEIEDILADVRRATTSKAVRVKYRERRDPKGRGAVHKRNGHSLMVLDIDEDHVRGIIQTLAGKIEWELESYVQETKAGTSILVPRQD